MITEKIENVSTVEDLKTFLSNPKNFSSVAKSFTTLNGQPLNGDEVYFDLEKLKEFAGSNSSFIGQRLVHVKGDSESGYSVDEYIIENYNIFTNDEGKIEKNAILSKVLKVDGSGDNAGDLAVSSDLDVAETATIGKKLTVKSEGLEINAGGLVVKNNGASIKDSATELKVLSTGTEITGTLTTTGLAYLNGGIKVNTKLEDEESASDKFIVDTSGNATIVGSLSALDGAFEVSDDKTQAVNIAGGLNVDNAVVSGDLVVKGKTISEEHKTLLVEDNIIVTNSNAESLNATFSGIAINTGGANDNPSTAGIMYDPADDTVKFGYGTLTNSFELVSTSDQSVVIVSSTPAGIVFKDKSGNIYNPPVDSEFKYNNITLKYDGVKFINKSNNEDFLLKSTFVFDSSTNQGLPLAIRDDSDDLTDSNLLKWSATGNKITDSGLNIVTTTNTTTISPNKKNKSGDQFLTLKEQTVVVNGSFVAQDSNGNNKLVVSRDSTGVNNHLVLATAGTTENPALSDANPAFSLNTQISTENSASTKFSIDRKGNTVIKGTTTLHDKLSVNANGAEISNTSASKLQVINSGTVITGNLSVNNGSTIIEALSCSTITATAGGNIDNSLKVRSKITGETALTEKFSVDNYGNTTIKGLSSLNGGINVTTQLENEENTSDKFTVDKSGNTTIKGTTEVVGVLKAEAGKVTITDSKIHHAKSDFTSYDLSSRNEKAYKYVINHDNILDRIEESSIKNTLLSDISKIKDNATNIPAGANGDYSVALNSRTVASGKESIAVNNKTAAVGESSMAQGYQSVSLGGSSFAGGVKTVTVGEGSFALGSETVAEGNYSNAEGAETLTIGEISHAEGRETVSIGYGSHAEGYKTVTVGQYSHSEGIENEAFGLASHSEGYKTKISSSDRLSDVSDIETEVVYPETSEGPSSEEVSGSGFTLSSDGTTAKTYERFYCTTLDGKVKQFAIVCSRVEVEFSAPYIGLVDMETGDFLTTWTDIETNISDNPREISISYIDINDRIINNLFLTFSYNGNEIRGAAIRDGNGNLFLYPLIDLRIWEQPPSQVWQRVYVSYDNSKKSICRLVNFGSGKYIGITPGSSLRISTDYSNNPEYWTWYGNGSLRRNNIASVYEVDSDFSDNIGAHAHSEGTETEAIGFSSHAEGFGSKAVGYYSHAEGVNNIVGGIKKPFNIEVSNYLDPNDENYIALPISDYESEYFIYKTTQYNVKTLKDKSGYELPLSFIIGRKYDGETTNDSMYDRASKIRFNRIDGWIITDEYLIIPVSKYRNVESIEHNGSASHVGGSNSRVLANASIAHGNNLIVTGDSKAVFGQYNEDKGHRTLFEIGSGSESSRSNVFEVYKDGTAKVDDRFVLKESIKVTHAELKAMRDTNQLVPGQTYRITDYTCCVNPDLEDEIISAGHRFDIIVTATSENTLSENAKATYSEGDSYFGGNFAYELEILQTSITDGDGQYISSVIATYEFKDGKLMLYGAANNVQYEHGGEPFVYIRRGFYEIDGETIECDYWQKHEYYIDDGDDIKSTIIDVYTKPIVSADGKSLDIDLVRIPNANLNAWELKYCLDKNISIIHNIYDDNNKGIIYWMKDEWNNTCTYDFKNIMFRRYLLKELKGYDTVDLSSGNLYVLSNSIFDVDAECFKYFYTFSYFNSGNNEIADNTISHGEDWAVSLYNTVEGMNNVIMGSLTSSLNYIDVTSSGNTMIDSYFCNINYSYSNAIISSCDCNITGTEEGGYENLIVNSFYLVVKESGSNSFFNIYSGYINKTFESRIGSLIDYVNAVSNNGDYKFYECISLEGYHSCLNIQLEGSTSPFTTTIGKTISGESFENPRTILLPESDAPVIYEANNTKHIILD